MIGSHRAITRVALSRGEQTQESREGFPKKFTHWCNKNKQKQTLKGFNQHHSCLDGLPVHRRAYVSVFEFGALLKGTSAVVWSTSLCDQNTFRSRLSSCRPFWICFWGISYLSLLLWRLTPVPKIQIPFGVATVDLGVYKDGNRCASMLLKH